MRVETRVWDPGERPPDEEDWTPRDPERCWEWTGVGEHRHWEIVDHNWALVSASEKSSVWMCNRCRKIEERVVVGWSYEQRS